MIRFVARLPQLRRFDEPIAPDVQATLDLADAQVPDLTDTLESTLMGLGDDVDDGDLTDAVQSHDINAALDAIAWEDFTSTVLEAAREVLADVIPAAGDVAARALYQQLRAQLTLLPPPPPRAPKVTGLSSPEPVGRFVARFDLVNPQSLAWIDGSAGELVREITEDTRSTIRMLMRRAFQDGVTPAETARLLRATIGLTDRGANAVYNYRAWLAGKGTDPLAGLSQTDIERLLRGGMRRNQIPRLQRTGLSADRIDQLVDGYRRRLIRERAETIARTELLGAANQGTWLLWSQAVDQGLLPKLARKVWIDTGDGRTCDGCRAAAGQVVPWDQPFSTMYGPVMMPPGHPRCRCTAGITNGEADS